MENQHLPQLNILLADDDSDDCMIFEEALKEVHSDTHLTVANNGQELMTTLDRTVPPPPDVIFLDLNMPLKNGAECLKEIRATPKLKDIPVIILSTSQRHETVNEMFAKGANYYICKPSDFSKMKSLLRKALSFDFHLPVLPTERDRFLLSVV